ncbi:hypothetical protein D3C76_324860 [compost metagenome]
MVRERHPHFEAGGHAQAVLAVEQNRQPTLQVHVADLAHAPLQRAVTRQVLDAVHGLVIAAVLIAGKVAGTVELRVDQPRLQQLHARQPREARCRHGLRIAEPGIAAKYLVCRLTGYCHRRVRADGLEQQVQRGIHVAEGCRAVIGAVHRQTRCVRYQLAVVDQDGLVLAADVLRGSQGVRLIALRAKRVALKLFGLADEIHRERVHRPALLRLKPLLRHGGEQGRVQATGQQRADRHIGVQLLAQRVVEQLAGALDRGRQVVLVRSALQLPIAADSDLPLGPPGQPMPGRQFADPAQRRAGGTPAQAQGIHQADRVQGTGEVGVRQHRLDLRAEQQPLLVAGVVQRLDPQAITYQQEMAIAPVEHGKGEHAIEVVAALLAPLQVSVQHHFGVAARLKGVPGLAQALAQGIVVIDLAGIHQRHFLTTGEAVGHRLHATAQVDDRQAPVAQQGMPVLPAAAGIWPAQGQGVGHGAEHLALLAQVAGVVHPAGNSAHGSLLTPEDGG